MNKVILIGRLTRDPDIRYTQGSEPLCYAWYTLAVNRGRKAKDGEVSADFIPCTAFGKNGEFAQKYLRKGMKICVIGRIRTNSFTKRDGSKAYSTGVVVEEHEFCESKKSETEGTAPAAATPQEQKQNSTDFEDFMNIHDELDEELPFV